MNECPADSKSRLDALLAVGRGVIGTNIDNTPVVVGIPIGLITGAKRGAIGISKGLSKSSCNCNSIDNTLNSVDSGLRELGKGYGEGVINTFNLFKKFHVE